MLFGKYYGLLFIYLIENKNLIKCTTDLFLDITKKSIVLFIPDPK